jgi:hypothetical protein
MPRPCSRCCSGHGLRRISAVIRCVAASPNIAAATHRDGAYRHRDRRLRRVDHGNAECLLEGPAVTGHAGTPHHDDAGAVVIPKIASDLDHAIERLVAYGRFGDRHFQRTFAGKAIRHTHLPEIADMARYRTRLDGDHTEPVGAGQRRQDAALGDAEDGLVRAFARDVQTRVGIAGDHKGIDVACRLDLPAQRDRDAVGMLLRFDAVWSLHERRAGDLRPPRIVQGQDSLSQAFRDGLVRVGIDHENTGSARHRLCLGFVITHYPPRRPTRPAGERHDRPAL